MILPSTGEEDRPNEIDFGLVLSTLMTGYPGLRVQDVLDLSIAQIGRLMTDMAGDESAVDRRFTNPRHVTRAQLAKIIADRHKEIGKIA